MMKLLKSGEPKPPRLVAGRVDVSGGTPSVAKGAKFSVSDIGAGQVKVVFSDPARQILSAVGCVIESTAATGYYVKVLSKTEATDVTFGIYQDDGTDGILTDNISFYFQILLSDSDV